MNGINVNQWDMSSELEKVENDYNMGFLTIGEYAGFRYLAREPYMGVIKNTILYIRDRWF